MIASVSGRVLAVLSDSVVVDVGGIGYEVSTTVPCLEGEDVTLFTYTHVREDCIQLFGFKTLHERDIFLMLIGVSGVGPKVGITIINVLSPDDVVVSVQNEDAARLTTVPGIGLKTAKRIILDLKSKMSQLTVTSVPAGMPAASSVKSDASMALMSLGYKQSQIDTVLRELPIDESVTSEVLIRSALKKLGKSR